MPPHLTHSAHPLSKGAPLLAHSGAPLWGCAPCRAYFSCLQAGQPLSQPQPEPHSLARRDPWPAPPSSSPSWACAALQPARRVSCALPPPLPRAACRLPPGEPLPSAGACPSRAGPVALLPHTDAHPPCLLLAALQTTPACSRPPTGSPSASRWGARSSARCLAWTLPAAPAFRRWAGRRSTGGRPGAACRVQPSAARGAAAAVCAAPACNQLAGPP